MFEKKEILFLKNDKKKLANFKSEHQWIYCICIC